MKSKTLVCLAMIASLGVASTSFAQGHDERDHHDRGDSRMEHRDVRGDRGDRGDRHEYERDRHEEFHYGARGPEWHRGGRIPREYRDHQYVVSNWRAHHLRQPPRGYQWVQVGGDYVLVAVASGIIADLLLNH